MTRSSVTWSGEAYPGGWWAIPAIRGAANSPAATTKGKPLPRSAGRTPRRPPERAARAAAAISTTSDRKPRSNSYEP